LPFKRNLQRYTEGAKAADAGAEVGLCTFNQVDP
jgi:hypothetical protein